MKPQRSQAARSQAARDQIAQAALTVFALKGFAAASMDDICLAAGCSKGGLYHHFRTKAAVLAAVVERLAARGALLPPFDADGPLTAPALGRVLLDAWAEAARDPALREQLRTGYTTMLASVATGDGRLDVLLRIGGLVQLLTRGVDIDAGDIASRLGIRRAA
jgi:AcrR family transcriptional regulator